MHTKSVKNAIVLYFCIIHVQSLGICKYLIIKTTMADYRTVYVQVHSVGLQHMSNSSPQSPQLCTI